MTNVEKLAMAGLVHPGRLTDDHTTVINDHMTDAEIDALLSVHQQLGGAGSMHSSGPHTEVF